MLQNFAGFFAFLYVYYDKGFDLVSLIGAGIDYKTNWNDLTDERKTFFTKMCNNNHDYFDSHSGADRCEQPFVDFRIDVLKYAQGAFLLTVVWSQIANVLIRKTQLASVFTYDRFFKNKAMFYAIASEIVIIIIVVYAGEKGFEMKGDSLYASVALWIIPLLFIWEEVRKWIARSFPDGWVRKYTVF
jgi:magnesium-transporting ATPase (P-type)